VLFRTGDGRAAALEDRCCHRSLPLSCGTLEAGGVRCGYHGMLYDGSGQCIEIPGQDRIPAKARVKSYQLSEKNGIVWIWFGAQEGAAPTVAAPDYPHHDNPDYRYGYGVFHYQAPYQLIHDNLLDLSHLGYVHLKTIGGNAKLHMNAHMTVIQDGDVVKVVRRMPASAPPPTYREAWRFGATVDRWLEIEFHVTHLRIWTGAVAPGTDALDDPARRGFHMRGLHGVTPETETTSHYFWSMASNRHPEMPDNLPTVIEQTRFTFEEDRMVIEAQYRNMRQFGPGAGWTDIHVDVGANRARRIIARLVARSG
jgi:vanillate O-demethylase monooxygenase subunit